mmetsp:Transcript_489/g.1371  ORF Transcript_489/g.1371 Transcript_489/m.1371 type:complete len:204 (-) Transcript_489:75-686(-)
MLLVVLFCDRIGESIRTTTLQEYEEGVRLAALESHGILQPLQLHAVMLLLEQMHGHAQLVQHLGIGLKVEGDQLQLDVSLTAAAVVALKVSNLERKDVLRRVYRLEVLHDRVAQSKRGRCAIQQYRVGLHLEQHIEDAHVASGLKDGFDPIDRGRHRRDGVLQDGSQRLGVLRNVIGAKIVGLRSQAHAPGLQPAERLHVVPF